MPGIRQASLIEIAFEQHGYVSTADARGAGIDPKRLADMAASGQAERRAQGLYRINIVPHDDLDGFMFATKWPRGEGIVSHESAAVLHGISEANPRQIEITVPRGFRTNAEWPAMIKPHRERLEPENIARIEAVPIVTAYWCILQMANGDSRTDLVRQAIDRARQSAAITFDQQAELVTLVNRKVHRRG